MPPTCSCPSLSWLACWECASTQGVGRLAIDLAADPRPGRVRYLLAQALRDPDLGIAFWVRGRSGYVDEAGMSISVPAWADGRAITRISGDGVPLAMLALDPELAEQRELIDAVAAVARLALENERLHAEVLAQLEEVRASRVRLVDAGDAERRRVERNLHDGAQQRLVALSLVLGQAQSQLNGADSELARTLAEATEELQLALAELRELARGIHPTLLTEDGLVAAAESLAERSPIPVVVASNLTGRFPPHI
jgi:signal transduction histidine kinase